MYILKNKLDIKNQRKAAYEIGINECTLCRILKGQQGTQKTTAYCIVKYYDPNADLYDYFKIK